MLWAGGSKYILLSALLYLPGTLLFVLAMREQKRAFSAAEWALAAVVALGAVVGIYGLATGAIVI